MRRSFLYSNFKLEFTVHPTNQSKRSDKLKIATFYEPFVQKNGKKNGGFCPKIQKRFCLGGFA